MIFLYRVFRAITEGGTGKGRRTVALVDHGQPGRRGPRKIRGPSTPRGDVGRRKPVVEAWEVRMLARVTKGE